MVTQISNQIRNTERPFSFGDGCMRAIRFGDGGISAGAARNKVGIAVIDVDNLLPRRIGLRVKIDEEYLSENLVRSGVRKATAFAHHVGRREKARWARCNIDLIETNENSDRLMALSAVNDLLLHFHLGSRVIPRLVIVSGDHFFCDLVAAAQFAGIEVQVWSRSTSASSRLMRLADEVRFIDDMVVRVSADACSSCPCAAEQRGQPN